MVYTTQEMEAGRKIRLEGAVGRYKFMGMTYLNDLSRDEIWISDPATFNDPFDLKIDIENLTDRSPFSNEEKLRTAFAELFLDNPDVQNFWFYDEELTVTLNDWIKGRMHYRQVIDHFIRRSTAFGVSCFAQDWDVPLMWAHYGASHKGICVEYAVKPMSFACASENLHLAQYYVRYMTELPTICLSEVLFSPHQVLPSFLATKHSDWSYEKEWRLVNFTDKQKYIPTPKHMEISALIVGLGFDMRRIEEVTAKAAELNVPIFLVRRPYGYDLKLQAF